MYQKLIKQKTDEALKALNDAKAIREELKDTEGAWPEDKQQAFDRAMEAFRAANVEVQQLKAKQAASEELDAGLSEYLEPRPTIPHAAPNGPAERQDAQKKREQHHVAFAKYLVMGEKGLSQEEYQKFMIRPQATTPEEVYALMGTVDNLGGFLVPDDFMNELIRDTAANAAIRPLARVRPTTKSAATFMTVVSPTGSNAGVYPSGVSGSWRSEGWVTGGTAPATQNQPTFGRERVPVHIWAPDVIELTMELLEDSAVNLDGEIRTVLAETKALDEDSAFTNGSGVGQPLGILTDSGNGNITTVQSGGATSQTYAGLANLFTALPAQYRRNASWMLNSVTYGLWLQLADSNGMPIFPANQLVTNLWSRPIVFNEFMPDGNGAGNDAVIFGDFRFYGIADRRDLRIIRLTERYAPNIGLLAVSRVGGQVLKPIAFRVQNVGA